MTNEKTLTRRWVREVDRRAIEEYGMSGLVLMENAARGAADVIVRELDNRDHVAIVCGKGNNAGDGFALARHLDARGIYPHVLLLNNPRELSGDALVNYRIIEKYVPNWVLGRDFSLDRNARDGIDAQLLVPGAIVDAMLGTGASGDPRYPFNEVIAILNEHPCVKFALDLPSGLDCDTGIAGTPTFKADHTVTFVAAKPGLLVEGARGYVGQLHVVDIGAPRVLVEEIVRLSGEEDRSQQTD
jgi:NAD(P)H-hydrate epimerase